MRTKVITLVLVGLTIGFLLALGLVALLRAIIEGEDVALSVAFSVLMLCLAAVIVVYITKTTR